MKTHIVSRLTLLAIVAAVLCWTGCATHKGQNTQQLLSAAGFRTVTLSGSPEQAAFTAMKPNTLQRLDINRSVVYAYVDKSKGIVYVGDEPDFHTYERLAFQQVLASEQIENASWNAQTPDYWGEWGPMW